MHKTNTKRTDDVAVARPVENAEECATSLAAADNKKGSQVHKTLSTENRDITIALPNTSGPKKKAIKRAKHSTDSAVLHTKGKGDEGSNDGGNPISSSQVVLYDPRVEGREVDTYVEETVKKRTKRSLPSKDSEKEFLPAKRRRVGKKLLPSEDSEASSDKDNLMSQMSIQTIIDAAKQLERIPELIQSVRDAGFGPFIDTKIKGSINRKCMSFILKNIDTSTMTVTFSEEKKIEINRYAIYHLYGIPNGHLSAPRPNETSEVLPELKRELGFKSDEDINAKKLLVILTSMVDGHLSSKAVINKNLALKIFYLILLNKGLCVGVGPHITAKEASMVKGLDYGRIKDMDFCQLVVDELQTLATNWQAYKKLKYKHMEGLAVAPLIMYLDSLIYKDLAHMGKETPRVLVLDDKNLTAISKADRNMGAQKGKEDWAFGKIITWKAKDDRVYKTISEEKAEETMAQRRKSICFAVAGRSFHGDDDMPAGTASEHQGALLIGDSNVVQSNTINSIKNLMQQVLNLTGNLQTTSQMLDRSIPGDNDHRKIENLKVQTANLLSMFDLFGDEQKYLLDGHRTDGRSSETNKLTSIPAAKKAHQTVELDVGKQAKIVEEGCKDKSIIMPKKKKKKRKVSNKTGSIGDQQLEETHPDPEHHAGSLPDISQSIQESNKELPIQMSCKKDAKADRPEIVTSAATITGMSTDKLAESLDPKDAETSNVNAEADAPDVETSDATVSEKSADMLAESPDRNDQNIKSASATNTEEVQNPKDYMQGEQAEHGFVPDVAHVDQCTSDNLLEDCVEGSKAGIEDENSAAEELCNKVVENTRADDDVQVTQQMDVGYTGKFMNGTFFIVLFDADETPDDGYNTITDIVYEEICKYSTRSCITENQDPSSRERMEKFRNQKFIGYGEMDVTIGEVADSFEDGAPIKTNIMTIMVDVARSTFLKPDTKRLIVPFMAVLSPGNLDDFSYEKPKVIPLQGETLNCGVYMMMFLMFWNGKSLFYIQQGDILYIRKRLLYLVLRWENLEVNLDLIETIDKDKLKKITSGQYNLVRKTTPVKPTMVVIVGLPDVNIPEPREIDDGKENYTEEQEYVLIGSQEDYSMECLKGRGRAEETTKNGEEDKETTKSGEEDKNQKQQKSVVARNNEDNSIEYLRTREAKVDNPSRLHQVLFTPINRNSSSPPGYKIDKDITEVFNAPVMHGAIPDLASSYTGADIKEQFGLGELIDGTTMDYIIDEMRSTSDLYATGERVLLSQGFIMHVLQVSVWKQTPEEVEEAAQKRDDPSSYTEGFNLDTALAVFPKYVDKTKSLLDAKLLLHCCLQTEAMQYSRRSTGSRTQEPTHANLLVYHRRSARERELADERNRAFLEQEAVGGLEQLGECIVRTAIMALPSPNAPPNIRRACRPSMSSMAELPRRVDGLHPREARNQHICGGEYPPLEHLERALEGQYLHALVPPETEKEVTASIVLCKVKRAMKRWLIRVRNKLRKQ
ncbi:hypothetical protein ACQ4PT_002634 [Festuca glaucescens]